MQSPLFRKLTLSVGFLLLIWVSIRYLMPIIAPFLLAILLALAAEPLVRFLSKKAKLPRAVATGIGVAMTLSILFLILVFLFTLLLRQLRSLAGFVPALENTALKGLDSLQLWLTQLVHSMYKRPKPTDNPDLAPYFAWKGQIACTRSIAPGEAMFGPGLKNEVADFFEKLTPLYEYFNQFKV